MKRFLYLFFLFLFCISSYAAQDPAVLYCKELGYSIEIQEFAEGEKSICVVEEKSFDAWDFFTGKVGKDYSFCAKKGYEILTLSDGKNSYSPDYAVCNVSDELIPVTDLMDFSNKMRDSSKTSYSPILSHKTTTRTSSGDFDWRDHNGSNWMTSVKSQSCGDCWAFSAIGAVEAKIKIARGSPDFEVDLSEQDLVSCSYAGSCSGGDERWALEYIEEYGITDESCFPETGTDEACSNKCETWPNRIWEIDDAVTFYGSVSQEDIKTYLEQKGPIPAGMFWDGYWDGDIYRCDEEDPAYGSSGHAVIIVGYNDSGSYWIMKNSWGTSVPGHDSGYFKLGYGECEIGSFGISYIEHTEETYSQVNVSYSNAITGTSTGFSNLDEIDGSYETYTEQCSGFECDGLEIENTFNITGALQLDLITYQRARGDNNFYLNYSRQNNWYNIGSIITDWSMIKYTLCNSSESCSDFSDNISVKYLRDSCTMCDTDYIDVDWLYLQAIVDSDLDGIRDEEDICPNNAGEWCNGCPEPDCGLCSHTPVCPAEAQPYCSENYSTSYLINSTYQCSSLSGDDSYGSGGEYACQGFCDGYGNPDYADNCVFNFTLCPDDDTSPPILDNWTYPQTNKTYNSINISVDIIDQSGIASAYLHYGSQIIEMTNSANTYSPEIAALGSDYRNRNLSFYINTSDADSDRINDSLTTISEVKKIFIENEPPQINEITPSNLTPEISEGDTLYFNLTYSDMDGDDLNISWYFDGEQKSEQENYTYASNSTSSGNHTLAVIISDGVDNATNVWNISVLEKNQPPYWINQPQNQTILEDTNLTYQLNASDPESNLEYYVNGTFSITQGILTWQPEKDYFGNRSILVTVSDGELNLTAELTIQVINVNDLPIITADNITANESNLIHINAQVTDVDDTEVDLNYSYPFNSTGSWQTNFSSSGTYNIQITADDHKNLTTKNITVIVRNDMDRDGIPDFADADNDNDGVNDTDDLIIGYPEEIITNLKLVDVNETNRTVELKENQTVRIQVHNRSLNLYNLTVEKQEENSTEGSLVVKGAGCINKTLYVEDINPDYNSVCLLDAEVDSISSISKNCTNETYVVCDGTEQEGYVCEDIGEYYRITGMQHSAVKEQCTYSWTCTDWSSCSGGIQTRLCTDQNNCNTTLGKPEETQNCDSGGGGGGGSFVSNTQAVSKTKVWPTLEKGEAEMEISDSSYSIYKIVFASKSTAHNAELSLRVLDESPVDDLDNVFKYVSVNQTNILTEQVEFFFSVNKSWYQENGLEPRQTKMLRYNQTWKELQTYFRGEDENVYYFKSTSPGFSYFAIISEKVQRDTTPTAEVVRNTSVQEPKTENATYEPKMESPKQVAQKKHFPWWILIFFGEVIVVAFVIYLIFQFTGKP